MRQTQLIELLTKSLIHMECLQNIRDLKLHDCWIAAGFIRNHVWDQISRSKTNEAYVSDVDVIYYNPLNISKNIDVKVEESLKNKNPRMRWSVKNQARIHLHNRDQPYHNCHDAMCHWPETATAIAARLSADNQIEILAPFGLADLFMLRVRPTPYFKENKLEIYDQRRIQKNWNMYWPEIQYE